MRPSRSFLAVQCSFLHFVVVVQVIPGAKSSVAEEVTPNDTLCHTCQFLKVHNGSSKEEGGFRQLSTDQGKINLQLYARTSKNGMAIKRGICQIAKFVLPRRAARDFSEVRVGVDLVMIGLWAVMLLLLLIFMCMRFCFVASLLVKCPSNPSGNGNNNQ